MTINANRKIISLTGPNCSFANTSACRVDVVAVGGSGGTAVINDNFDSYTSMSQLVSVGDWKSQGSQSGGAISLETTGAYSGKSVKGAYPASSAGGAVYVWQTADLVPANTSEVYISFRAKMPGNKHGCKFVKVFGQNDGGYANCTFNLDYTGIDNGGFLGVIYGDGTGTTNDAQCQLYFDSGRSSTPGRASSPSISRPMDADFASTDWGTGWHLFRFHLKFNSGASSGNEAADGEIYVEIDGNVYLNATGLFNRHYSNLPIDRIEWFGQSQGSGPAFDLWIDEVQISTGGWL